MKISIIGAGISGLSAGCFLQMKGFKTEIYEKHDKPGGLCTSWKIGDYTFDGCLHWLLGSNDKNPFYQLWSELIDMDEVEFVNHDIRVEIEVKDSVDRHGSKVFHLYTDISRLEKYLLDLAPEDSRQIKKLIRSMRRIQSFEVPPEVKTLPTYYSWKQKIGSIKHLPLLFFMLRNRYKTNYDFAAKLKNPFLREAFQLIYDGEEFPMLIITFPLAFSDLKSTGYPVGGSLRFAERIEQKYLSLGGKIRYNSGVKEIRVENDKATGLILEDGSEIPSDITVSAADWYFTVFKALKGNFVNEKILDLRDGKSLQVYYSVINVSLGISKPLNHLPYLTRFPVTGELVSPDGTAYTRMELHIYNYDPTLAPAGKACVSASFYTTKSDYWIDLYQNDRQQYHKVKNEFAAKVIDLLDQKTGDLKEFIEVSDVLTPATFYRYTGNWKGSTQGWLPGKNIMASSPVKFELPGLKNFFYASHWSMPGGGTPIAIKAAHDLASIISSKYRSVQRSSQKCI
jgi:phytoene dehydrogenase-like protein